MYNPFPTISYNSPHTNHTHLASCHHHYHKKGSKIVAIMPHKYYRLQDLDHHEPRRRHNKLNPRRNSQHTPPVADTPFQSFPLENISSKTGVPPHHHQRTLSKGTTTTPPPIHEPRFHHTLPTLVPLLGPLPLPIYALSSDAATPSPSMSMSLSLDGGYAGVLWQRLWRSMGRFSAGLGLGDEVECLTDGAGRLGLKRKVRRRV